jgi:hypothetical protein
MRDATPKTLSVNGGDHQKLIDELYGILKTIPMEYPPGWVGRLFSAPVASFAIARWMMS